MLLEKLINNLNIKHFIKEMKMLENDHLTFIS